MYNTGNLNLVLCDDLEGWGGEGGGGVQGGGDTCMPYGQFILMCGKNHHNIVK